MLRIDRRLLANIEWPMLAMTLLLVGCGLATILSATYQESRPLSPYFIKQSIWAGAGLVALVLAISFDYRKLHRYGYLVYLGMLVMLAAVALVGSSVGGARRWIHIGPLALQPSEFVKIGLVVVLSTNLHRWAGGVRLPLRRLVAPIALAVLPMAFILRQPDLGTVILLGLVAFSMLLVAGLPLRLVLAVAVIVVPTVPKAIEHLEPYQQRRIKTFLQPESEPLGAGYHIIQSKIAIGSGMLNGKGYLKGTQNSLRFLPEQHTDFVFSVFAEEWGFIGALVLLALYAALILRALTIASKAKDNLGALLVVGLIATVFWQLFINIAMTSGVMPVVGITLPFLSYGGSSLLTSLASIGLVMNVSMRRYTY